MENVKYSKEEEIRFGKHECSHKRFIVTEPYEWHSEAQNRTFLHGNSVMKDRANLKQFLLDPDVKESLKNHMQHFPRQEKSP